MSTDIKYEWQPGCPDKVYGSEWFLAKLKHGRRAVLRALPKEGYSFDYTTADATYFTRDWVVAWMQLPDSEFVPFVSMERELLAALKEAERAIIYYSAGVDSGLAMIRATIVRAEGRTAACDNCQREVPASEIRHFETHMGDTSQCSECLRKAEAGA